jgi:hypothetical protein
VEEKKNKKDRVELNSVRRSGDGPSGDGRLGVAARRNSEASMVDAVSSSVVAKVAGGKASIT